MATTPQKPPPIARTLLNKAFPSADADRIFTDKVLHRPLLLQPTDADPKTATDARSHRQQARAKARQLSLHRAHQKPKPLSAKEKRLLRVHEIPASARKYNIYEPLHQMWVGYMQELLGGQVPVTPAVVAKLVSAEFVGAEVEVVRCRCVSRVGIKGIVVKDTRFMFEIVTRKDVVKSSLFLRLHSYRDPIPLKVIDQSLGIPKEHAVFRFEIPTPEQPGEDALEPRNLVFELHGSQFEYRSTDRASKKFKQRNLDDL
ncbi:hypothetical protein FGG08_000352 [Glutinoglossum americanum]|uniref:Ribonuclease P protein subunit n=1 Tax=Glutinoglossum americanum TaxID=1670608 RepID=A0A9P8I3X7_9PEZI|nr:hypothetical protein FGG08_000352 [Glutinoglossum americanum]